MNSTSSALIETLGLQPHPEGGHYREIYRSRSQASDKDPQRSSLTSIYFLLAKGEHSRWHRLDADEVWHFYEGDDLELLHYDPESRIFRGVVLGSSQDQAAVRVYGIPKGHWQAARSRGSFSLVGCSMGPGFEFSGFSFVADLPSHRSHFGTQLAPYLEML